MTDRYHTRLATSYLTIASIRLANGRPHAALDSTRRAVDHLIALTDRPDPEEDSE